MASPVDARLPTVRNAMAWTHTWLGVVAGALLSVVWFCGTMSVFDHEIDRWMKPATRLAAAPVPSLDSAVRGQVDRVRATTWYAQLPTPREPFLNLSWVLPDGEEEAVAVDPRTSQPLRVTETDGGIFFYVFHYRLHFNLIYRPLIDLGYWLAGFAGVVMLLACVTGIWIHRRLIKDFFVLRTGAARPRMALDVHNVLGVAGLLFHVLIAFSGLLLFADIYMPALITAGYGDGEDSFVSEAYNTVTREPAGRPARMASLDAMRTQAESYWKGARTEIISAEHWGNANAVVTFRRVSGRQVPSGTQGTPDAVNFDGATGRVLAFPPEAPVASTYFFLTGLHVIEFDHWALRWLYFVLGLGGWVMIGTGFIYWLDARRARAGTGWRLARAVCLTVTVGLLLATIAYFVANRVIPDPLAVGDRASWERRAFFCTWLAAFAHAWWFPRAAWSAQTIGAAALAVCAVVLNAWTTGQPPWTAWGGEAPVVAGVDLTLLAVALLLIAARRLDRHGVARASAEVADIATTAAVARSA